MMLAALTMFHDLRLAARLPFKDRVTRRGPLPTLRSE
jgi:hypothetical protein